MALLQNLQCCQQFGPEIGSAIFDRGEGRERTNHVLAAGEAAKTGFHSPDAQQNRAVYTIALFNH